MLMSFMGKVIIPITNILNHIQKFQFKNSE